MRDGGEVPLQIVRQFGVEMRVDREGRIGGEEQGVGVVGMGHGLGTNERVGAQTVVDGDRLLPLVLQAIGQSPGQQVHASTRRVGDHELDRFDGPILG